MRNKEEATQSCCPMKIDGRGGQKRKKELELKCILSWVLFECGFEMDDYEFLRSDQKRLIEEGIMLDEVSIIRN